MTLVDRLLKYSKKCVTERLDEDFARAVREAAEEIDDRSIKRCYNCGEKTVGWSSDGTFEEYLKEGDGIVGSYICQNCQALIEVYVPLEEEE